MGGYNAGEVASGMATTVLSTELEAAFLARSPDTRADDGYVLRPCGDPRPRHEDEFGDLQCCRKPAAVCRHGNDAGAGAFHDNKVTAAHIGDWWLYRLRDGDFAAAVLTRDSAAAGTDRRRHDQRRGRPPFSQNKNLVTRALGVDPEVEAEICDYEVLPGDIYLLCSDGLNDMVEDEETALTLQALGANLELAATQLIQMANDNGGRDNVSVILVKICASFRRPRAGGGNSSTGSSKGR